MSMIRIALAASTLLVAGAASAQGLPGQVGPEGAASALNNSLLLQQRAMQQNQQLQFNQSNADLTRRPTILPPPPGFEGRRPRCIVSGRARC